MSLYRLLREINKLELAVRVVVSFGMDTRSMLVLIYNPV